MIMNLGIVAILWFGGKRINIGDLTQGELTAFTNYMTQILLALIVFANLIIIFTKAFASANRISEIFDIPSEEKGSLVPDSSSERMIEFRSVRFAYDNSGDDALHNISFSIGRGQMLGIIGGTGSGKSTIASLIPCFYRATEGCVLVGGQNVNDCDPEKLRQKIGYVPQKAVLFSGTVRDNMKWRNQDASDEEIINALKTAQAWEFVEKMPNGLDSVISQGGKNLSGGQKQRISIARALIGGPDIVILDDSTSALDYSTDLALRKALKTDLPDTTVVMISQRTTSLKDAELIVVVDDGKAVGTGNHSELIDSCEVYREIYKSQMNETEDSAS